MKCKTKIEISGSSLEWQTDRGTCTLENMPIVGMWSDTNLAALMAGWQGMLGSDRFNWVLQNQGRQSIEADWQIISEYADFATGFDALNQVLMAAGWGIWELVSLDWQKQECRFRIKNNWESGYQRTLKVCWGSSFVAGKLAGYCSKLFDTNCWAEQTAFIARGDEFDEFVVQPSQRSVEEEIDKLLAIEKVAERQKQEESWRKSEERKQAEAQLIRYQEQLADLVLERTAELAKTNQKLQEQIIKLQQAESERSLALAQEQAARTRAEALLQERDATLLRLQESEERYRSLVVATSQIVWVTNAEGLEPNMPTWLAYTGQTEAETQNWGWLDAVHPQDRDRVTRDWYLAIHTKSLYDTEYRIRGNDGNYRYFAVRGVPVFDVTATVREWVGVCTDIHDRKLTEEALRESEARFQKLVANVPGVICQWRLHTDGSVSLPYTSSGCRELQELEPEEMQQNPNLGLDITHPDDRPIMEKAIAISAQTLQPIDAQVRIITRSGKTKWVQVAARPEKLANDDILWDCLTTDVTDRKLAEEAIRQSELKFRALYESTGAAVLLSEQNIFFNCNSAAVRMFRATNVEQLCNKHPAELSPPYQPNGKTSFQIANQYLEIVLEKGTHSFEWVHRRFDGTDFPTYITLTAIDSGNRKILQAIVQDLTERKQAEEALRKSEARERERSAALEQALHKLQSTQAQLIQSEKMSSLGQLVAGVAHEINNPVNFIYGNLTYANQYVAEMMELLRFYQQNYSQSAPGIQHKIKEIDIDFLMEDFPKLLSSMKVGAERIREIVLSLRNFSRLDEAEMKEVNVHEGIDSTLMILQNRLKSKSDRNFIQVIKEYGNLPPVECYPGQLNQVFMNLLTNAIDALETWGNRNLETLKNENPQPIVLIRTEVNQDWVTIRIIDNGAGMKEEIRNRLFDPFFTTKPVGKGTGLGLSISYQIIVEKHGGKLECISELGKGAEFAIQIPIRQSR